MTSVKGYIGHTMGVAGPLNVAVAAEAWRRRRLPPTWPAETAADLDPLHVVRGSSRALDDGGPIMVTALGFGGMNAAVLVGGVP